MEGLCGLGEEPFGEPPKLVTESVFIGDLLSGISREAEAELETFCF